MKKDEEVKIPRRSSANLKTRTPLNMPYLSGVKALSGVERPHQAKTHRGFTQEPFNSASLLKGQAVGLIPMYCSHLTSSLLLLLWSAWSLITQPSAVLYLFVSGHWITPQEITEAQSLKNRSKRGNLLPSRCDGGGEGRGQSGVGGWQREERK